MSEVFKVLEMIIEARIDKLHGVFDLATISGKSLQQ